MSLARKIQRRRDNHRALELRALRCPKPGCGMRLDTQTNPDTLERRDRAEPQDGEISICGRCASAIRFVDGGWQLLDLDTVPHEIRLRIAELQGQISRGKPV